MIFIYLLIILAILLYVYLTWNFDYWLKRGVPAPKTKILFGDLPNGLTRKKNIIYDFQKIYDDFKGTTPFVGIIQTRSPRLIALEPEIIKDILIRKFQNFRNSEFADMVDAEHDPLFAKNPFFIKDEEWKEKRAEITPAFTNNRLKALYPLIQDVSGRMAKYIIERSEKNEPFEARELSAKYTTDVVSNCIFGIDAESFTKEKPEIREMGRRLFVPSATIFLKVFLAESFPFLRKYLKIQFVAADVQRFFVDLMQQALKYRQEKNVQREDFLDYVIHLKEKKNITELEMASHTISFFSDGFETSSIAICHTLYELAKNKRVQDKLREVINKNCDKDGQINFDTLQEITYLENVMYEALRLHSPAVVTSRQCTEECELEYDGKKVAIEKGMNVYVPILMLHYDPEHFVEPTTFQPERFDDGNLKSYLDRCVLLPFGAGPRICLGMRFALLQSKVALVTLVRNFEISVNEKTQDNPFVLEPKEFLNVKVGGLWLNFKPLKEE